MFSGSSDSSPRRSEGPIAAPPAVEPTYCPRCGGLGDSDGGICRQCGETLIPCGYCSTCEAFWRRPLAEPCPKHDVALEDAPPPLEPLGTPGQVAERWVTVATYGHPNEANAPRIRLEAEGVPTFLDGARVAGSTLYQVATGGVRLQVPESLVAPARVLLAQTWTPPDNPAADPGLDDEDDPWAGLAPTPGTRRRAVMKAAILLFLFGPGLIALCNALGQGCGLIR